MAAGPGGEKGVVLLLMVVSWPCGPEPGKLPGIGGVMEGVEGFIGLGAIPVAWLPGPMSWPIPHTVCSLESNRKHTS